MKRFGASNTPVIYLAKLFVCLRCGSFSLSLFLFLRYGRKEACKLALAVVVVVGLPVRACKSGCSVLIQLISFRAIWELSNAFAKSTFRATTILSKRGKLIPRSQLNFANYSLHCLPKFKRIREPPTSQVRKKNSLGFHSPIELPDNILRSYLRAWFACVQFSSKSIRTSPDRGRKS